MANERSPGSGPTGITLHLTPEPVWRAQRALPEYRPEPFDAEGFVHCTDGETEVLAVANRYYRNDPRPFLLLDVDLGRVTAPAIFEDAERRYPHIYGPIPLKAVRRARRVERAPDGAFTAIGDVVEDAGL